MTQPDGYVAVGPNWPGAWWSDGYSDYVRHFLDALEAIPDWAPEGENHLLGSTSVITYIRYEPRRIEFNTFDRESKTVLRLASRPTKLLVDGKPAVSGTWKWEPLKKGGILRMSGSGKKKVIEL